MNQQKSGVFHNADQALQRAKERYEEFQVSYGGFILSQAAWGLSGYGISLFIGSPRPNASALIIGILLTSLLLVFRWYGFHLRRSIAEASLVQALLLSKLISDLKKHPPSA